MSRIIYSYNDMAWFLITGEGFSNVDFFSYGLFSYLGRLYGYLNANNILIIFTLFLTFVLCHLLFSKIHISSNLTMILSLLYTLTVSLIFRFISVTPGLYFIYFIPLVLLLFLNKPPSLFIGLIILIIFSFSNYYGFFCFVIVCFWYLFDLISKIINFKKFIQKLLLFSAPVLLGILLFFFPLLKSNLTFSGDYTKENNEKRTSEKTVVYRPLEDWYNLSFRPWYFFIPPKSSIFFGEFSKNIHKKIESTNYYLADDYMEEEMAGSYMGWHFLIGLGTIAVILLLKRYKNIEFKTFKTVYKNKEMIIRSFFIIFCILLISGPPSFTIGGVEIYTPTYLLYYIVPVFRTLVRWAVVIYLFVLIINSFLVQDLYNLMKTKIQKILFILAFLTLNFVIFAIKIPVININKPPQEIAFVKGRYPESVPYAVYPKGDYYSIFWIISHEDLLINPVNFVNYETGFDSNEFSKKLITEEGIREFLDKDLKYLIYYPENISDDDLEKIAEINPSLKSRENIYEFFRSNFGDGVVVGESVVFEINN